MSTQLKFCRNLAVVIVSVALGVGAFALNLVAHHNFHSLAGGRIYRSAQMSSNSLAQTIRELGIRSVVNLRGDNPGKDWYDAETNATQQLGVSHFDFDLCASREVSDEEMEELLATIDHAPKPVLIHCKNGADRTGLVGALCLYSLERQSAEQADRQLTPFWGHIPCLFWRDTVAMDRSYWRYVRHHHRKPFSESARSGNRGWARGDQKEVSTATGRNGTNGDHGGPTTDN